MCLHYTHIVFSCGHKAELPRAGRYYKPPSYCDRVKKDLDWYHTQPERTPEPVPYPPPQPCPMIFGTLTYTGNAQVWPLEHPCADCITRNGLKGINAIEAQRAKQEQQSPRRRRKGRWSEKKEWVWKPVKGHGWNGLQKVPAGSPDSAKIPENSLELTPGELGTMLEHEAMISQTPAYAGPISTPTPETAPTISPKSLQEYSHAQTPAENFAYWEEAGRRGLEMFTNFPDTRIPMQHGMVPQLDPSVASMFAPAYSYPPLYADASQPVFAPYSVFSQPVYYLPADQIPGPVLLEDGTVELPDDEEPCREALAFQPEQPEQPDIEVTGPGTPSEESDSTVKDDEQSTLKEDEQCPERHSEQNCYQETNGCKSEHSVSQLLDILPEENRRLLEPLARSRPSSPLVVNPRRKSTGDMSNGDW